MRIGDQSVVKLDRKGKEFFLMFHVRPSEYGCEVDVKGNVVTLNNYFWGYIGLEVMVEQLYVYGNLGAEGI